MRPFGDGGVEVPRLALNADALQALLQREHQERAELAEKMSALGQGDLASALEVEAVVFARYLASA